jgi:hypothetical protein
MGDDTGTDWAALADQLERHLPPYVILDAGATRAAAVGLRRLARLDTAIGAQPELADSLRKAQAIIRHKFSPAVANPVQRAAEMMDRLAAVLGSGEQPEGTEPRRPLPPVNPGQRMPGGPTPQP